MISKRWIQFGGAAVLSAALGIGALLAQGGGAGNGFHHPRGAWMMRLANQLDLSEAQKAQAKTIFQDARKQNEPLAAQLKQIHQNAEAAVKAGKSEAELRQIAAGASPLVGQLAGNHLVAQSRFYQILTDAQRAKLDELRSQMKSRFENRHSRHNTESKQ
jgi:periplasmic protein CpxP/Spy